MGWLVTLAGVMPATVLAGVMPAAGRAPPSPALTVELGAAWQLRNTAQVSNEPPNTGFKIDELTGDGPFPAGRLVLDWPLNKKHRLRFLIAPLGIDEAGTASQPIVFQDTTFAPGPVKVKYRFDSYRASYRYVSLATTSRRTSRSQAGTASSTAVRTTTSCTHSHASTLPCSD